MKILLIKTSSLGDIIHTLPALSDASIVVPDLEFHWLVEESFSEIPAWHNSVSAVIPIAWRRWRKKLFSYATISEISNFWCKLREQEYDVIIDAQGLIKSAVVALLARGERNGLDFQSAREALASIVYHKKYHINLQHNAILRMRELFSKIFAYKLPENPPQYSITNLAIPAVNPGKYLMFLHGTTWESKMWPREYWLKLAQMASVAGFEIKLLWYNAPEKARAEYLHKHCANITIISPQKIADVAGLIKNATAVIGLDTGLTHLATAVGVPVVSLYSATNPLYSSHYSSKQVFIASDFSCAPCMSRTCKFKQEFLINPACFATVPPEQVWDKLNSIIG